MTEKTRKINKIIGRGLCFILTLPLSPIMIVIGMAVDGDPFIIWKDMFE